MKEEPPDIATAFSPSRVRLYPIVDGSSGSARGTGRCEDHLGANHTLQLVFRMSVTKASAGVHDGERLLELHLRTLELRLFHHKLWYPILRSDAQGPAGRKGR